MRKVILNLAVSLDGYIEGPNGEYDWCLTDQDYGMSEFFAGIDTIFIGRKSYEMIAGSEDSVFPGVKIYVFSDTLTAGNSDVTVVSKADFEQTVNTVMNEEGRSIWLFGGAELTSAFLEKKLIGEFLLSLHPVILGSGKPLFQNIKDRVNLMLIDTQTYSSGLTQLKYIVKPEFDYNAFDIGLEKSALDILDN